jgi:transmembrane sensor
VRRSFRYTTWIVRHIPEHIQHLINRFFEGSITPEEKKQLDNWYHSLSSAQVEVFTNESEVQLSNRMKHRLGKMVKKDRRSTPPRIILLRVAAAVLIIGVSISTFLFLYPHKVQEKFSATIRNQPASDILPGSNKATLTLGNGLTIELDGTSARSLGKDGGINIVKLSDGQVEYQDDNNSQHNQSTVYNTISTPRGGQYQITLADGTRVWLNASSSVRFPVDFNDSVREVEMVGEAYFEVAKDPSKPFRVKVKDNYIRVLGTHFNVMAYDNEPSINTTLLEGSLRVENKKSSSLIAPGQQAKTDASGSIKVIKDADVEEAIAWKSGYFLFNSSDIKSIMHQVERWYDADVNYLGEVKLHFTGQVSRNMKVSELLRKLELTNEVHFKIEGKKITVSP